MFDATLASIQALNSVFAQTQTRLYPAIPVCVHMYKALVQISPELGEIHSLDAFTSLSGERLQPPGGGTSPGPTVSF